MRQQQAGPEVIADFGHYS